MPLKNIKEKIIPHLDLWDIRIHDPPKKKFSSRIVPVPNLVFMKNQAVLEADDKSGNKFVLCKTNENRVMQTF